MSPLLGKLLILVGPAGAGKTTLARAFIAADPARRAFSVSHTTRPMRAIEQDGRDYWFVQRGEFEALRDQDGFAEWAEVHGNYYGTSRREIARLSGPGQVAVFDVDIVGAHNLWRQYPQQSVLVFVLPPSWAVMVQRLTDRGSETEATLRRRLRTARLELQELLDSPAPWQTVLNRDLPEAAQALEAAVAGASGQPHAQDFRPAVEIMLRDACADSRTADSAGEPLGA